MTYRDYHDPNAPLEPSVRPPAPVESDDGGSNLGMILGGIAFLALIFGMAFYFNGDGDGGRNIATNKNPAGISQPATPPSTTGSGAVGR